MYPQDGSVDGVSPSPSFPQIERDVLAFWQEDGTFEASIAQRDDAAEWVFYDGPPFANGLPHYGHLLTGYAKDVFPRFQTMRGKQVPRRFGWDTHGLPAELEAERQLGLAGKTDIEAMGIAAFNAAAKEGVLRYTDQWQEYVTRQARWVDFTNDYKTLDLTFMESVLWAFKELYDRGLVYEGYRVLPYCWRDQTPLSNHELRMDDDVYQMRQDPSVTVSFPLEGHRAEALGLTSVHVLAWTTTPWTLPTNLALAAGPTIEYAVVEVAEGAFAVGTLVLLARDLVPAHARELGYGDGAEAQAAITRTILGADLAGVRYVPLFDTYTARTDVAAAWQVLVADFVSTADGTGLVHLAPAYGEDDQRVCEAAGIPVIVSLDDAGCFLPEVAPVAGMLWSDANQPLIRLLRESGRLLRERSYEHSYPHCWRCRNPLIYRAVTSWYIRVTAFRDRMVELNEDITWVPANVKHGQFGTWLEHARDWSISRNRYFGSPIPIWRSDDPAYPRMDVYGSLAALERDFGYLPRNASGEPDLHRPYIDDLTRPNPDDPTGRSTMRRIPDVFDVWFDSGSMPFAQAHYPFAQHEWFESHHPADYIVEYIGQTRGWFYTMHVLSTALFDRPAFTNVLCHGIVLGSDGQKMSKSRRNYPDVREVFDRDGADAMRWFLLSSAVLRGGNLVVTEEAIREGVRQLLLPLWNTWYFFSLYANTAEPGGYRAQWRTSSTDDLDRYLFAKLHVLVRDVTTDLEAFDATLAAAKLRDFAEVLTNWYVRRSRDRFWRGTEAGTGPADAATAATHRAAFDTLYTVLETLCRLAAPLLPLIGEHVWRGLTGERSVHLTDWPDPTQIPADPDLVAAMDAVREVCSATLALRKQAARRVRLPLARLTVIVEHPESLSRFTDILRDELNVKTVSVEPLTADSARAFGVTKRLTVLARVAGPRLGSRVQEAIAAARNDDWHTDGDGVIAGGIRLGPSEIELVLQAGNSGGDTAIGLLGNGGFVLLDIATTPELEAEGLARDIVRAVQDARKHAGFDVSDRICCDLSGSNAVVAAVAAHRDFIAAETLSREVTAQVADLPDTEGLAKLGNGEKVLVAVVRA